LMIQPLSVASLVSPLQSPCLHPSAESFPSSLAASQRHASINLVPATSNPHNLTGIYSSGTLSANQSASIKLLDGPEYISSPREPNP
jgi:hypothetical protein